MSLHRPPLLPEIQIDLPTLGLLVGAHLSSRRPELRPPPALPSSGPPKARRRCRVLSLTRHHPQSLVP